MNIFESQNFIQNKLDMISTSSVAIRINSNTIDYFFNKLNIYNKEITIYQLLFLIITLLSAIVPVMITVFAKNKEIYVLHERINELEKPELLKRIENKRKCYNYIKNELLKLYSTIDKTRNIFINHSKNSNENEREKNYKDIKNTIEKLENYSDIISINFSYKIHKEIFDICDVSIEYVEKYMYKYDDKMPFTINDINRILNMCSEELSEYKKNINIKTKL